MSNGDRMNTLQTNGVESRRGFLKKSVYMAPALMLLGSLNALMADQSMAIPKVQEILL